MILELANQVRWEWFKLRRRWMLYILLAVLVLITQVSIWATIFAYNEANARIDEQPIAASATSTIFVHCSALLDGEVSELSAHLMANDPNVSQAEADEAVQRGVTRCQDWDQRRQEDVEGFYSLITPPGSASFTMSIGQSIGLILVAILTASLIGTEHGWGTLRFLLVRGVRRWHVLASKLGIAWLAFAAALLVVGVLGTLSGQIIDGLLSGTEGLENDTSWGGVSEAFGRALLSVIPLRGDGFPGDGGDPLVRGRHRYRRGVLLPGTDRGRHIQRPLRLVPKRSGFPTHLQHGGLRQRGRWGQHKRRGVE